LKKCHKRGASAASGAIILLDVTETVRNARMIALVAAGVGLLCACGLPVNESPPKPPPPPRLDLMTVDPTRLAFTAAAGGRAEQVVTVVNRSRAPLGVGRLRLASTDAGYASPYRVLGSTCPRPLPAHQGCTVTVEFAPGTAGYSADRLIITVYTGTVYEMSVAVEGKATSPPSIPSR
jgi:hypothetical protein